MKQLQNLDEIKSFTAPAKSALVVLPQKVNHDKVAAALSLFLALRTENKEVTIVCPKPMTVEFSSLVGVDKITQNIGGKNLVISFDYIEDSIEKVSYHIENNKFNLVISPKDNFSPLAAEKVVYSYSGGSGDVVFILGAGTFADLGDIYFKNKDFFDQAKTVALDIYPNNTQFAKVNLVDAEVSCYSEMVTNLLVSIGISIDEDLATNLMAGIDRATNTFTMPKVTGDTFEAAAILLRAGARRQVKSATPPPSASAPQAQKPKDWQPMPEAVSMQKPPEEKPSPDWFEPKIYKGNTAV